LKEEINIDVPVLPLLLVSFLDKLFVWVNLLQTNWLSQAIDHRMG